MPSTTCAARKPSAAGDFSTTLTITPTDALTTTPLAITATCRGTTNDLYSNPSSLMLGEVRVGGGPITRTIQLLADGGSPLTLAGPPALEVVDPSFTIGPLSQATTQRIDSPRFLWARQAG